MRDLLSLLIQKGDHEQRGTWVIRLWCEQIALKKRANRLEKIRIFHMFFTAFPLLMTKSESLPSLFALSLFFKEQVLWFAPLALYKKWLLANHSCCSLQKSKHEWFSLFQEQIALLLFCSFAHKKEWFARNTKEQIPNPSTLPCLPSLPPTTSGIITGDCIPLISIQSLLPPSGIRIMNHHQGAELLCRTPPVHIQDTILLL